MGFAVQKSQHLSGRKTSYSIKKTGHKSEFVRKLMLDENGETRLRLITSYSFKMKCLVMEDNNHFINSLVNKVDLMWEKSTCLNSRMKFIVQQRTNGLGNDF